MLQFKDLSFWEKVSVTEGIDFLVIGGGIVGIACAISLREKHPNARIVLLERGYLPTGASTKNAGFACFGSVTELADDLNKMDPQTVWDTVDLRWRGLKRLQERFDPKVLELKIRGSWDLLHNSQAGEKQTYSGQLAYFNEEIKRITGQDNCYSEDVNTIHEIGFQQINTAYFNRLEGELNTGNLLLQSNLLLAQNKITCLYGIEVKALESHQHGVTLETNFGALQAAKVAVTVNGFAKELLKDERIQPARAQVLVTSPIERFELPGTFHYDKGYYYFRGIGNRILLGGGRNLDFSGETTTEFATTEQIQGSLHKLLKEVIIPGKPHTIDYNWSGIMGVGNGKKPLIERLNKHVGIGVRMGGMGVAIGSLVGEQLAGLLDS
jgi:gamma-glutamylputrescine oxidase